MANFVALAALIEPGDEVIFEHPVYDLIPSAAGFLQANIKWLPRPASSNYQPNLEALQEIMSTETKLIVLTNLHNPSSAFIPPATMQEIGCLARAVGARVLVDEIYLDSAFDADLRTATLFGDEFVTTNSLTKVYGLSGLRCGWVVGEPQIIEKMWRLSDLMYGIPAHPAERLSIAALARIPQLKARSRAILTKNIALVNQFLATSNHLESAPAQYGMTIFPKLNGIPVDKFCDHLRHKYETTVVPGSFFDMPDHFRLSFGCDEEILAEGLNRVTQALGDLG
jgi:aspartate/methionine/tyrosine aminotransferase